MVCSAKHTSFSGLLRWTRGFTRRTRRGFCGGPALSSLTAGDQGRGDMSSHAFVFVLSFGSALLALWVHVRFPKIAPEHVGKTLLHTGIAFALLRLVPGMVESP